MGTTRRPPVRSLARFRVLSAGVGVLVAAVVLAGCGGQTGGGGDADSAVPTVVATTADPSPTAPVIAPSARYASDQDAVRDVARLYFEALTQAELTGDTSQLHGVASPDCVNCNETIAEIDRRRDAGQRMSPGFYIYVTDVKVGPILEEYQVYPSLVTISVKGDTVLDAGGGEVEAGQVVNETMHVVVQDTDDGWRVVEINHLTPEELELLTSERAGYR